MMLFFNVSYYGILLVVMIYMLDLEKQSNDIIPWCILSGLLLMSKGTFLVFAPIILVGWLACKLRGGVQEDCRIYIFSGMHAACTGNILFVFLDARERNIGSWFKTGLACTEGNGLDLSCFLYENLVCC
jgi:hypothetical protein